MEVPASPPIVIEFQPVKSAPQILTFDKKDPAGSAAPRIPDIDWGRLPPPRIPSEPLRGTLGPIEPAPQHLNFEKKNPTLSVLPKIAGIESNQLQSPRFPAERAGESFETSKLSKQTLVFEKKNPILSVFPKIAKIESTQLPSPRFPAEPVRELFEPSKPAVSGLPKVALADLPPAPRPTTAVLEDSLDAASRTARDDDAMAAWNRAALLTATFGRPVAVHQECPTFGSVIGLDVPVLPEQFGNPASFLTPQKIERIEPIIHFAAPQLDVSFARMGILVGHEAWISSEAPSTTRSNWERLESQGGEFDPTRPADE